MHHVFGRPLSQRRVPVNLNEVLEGFCLRFFENFLHIGSKLSGSKLVANGSNLSIGRFLVIAARRLIVGRAHVDRHFDLVVPLALHTRNLHLRKPSNANEEKGYEGHDNNGNGHRAIARQALANLGKNKT